VVAAEAGVPELAAGQAGGEAAAQAVTAARQVRDQDADLQLSSRR
jgi:hypothetical protein